MAKWVKCTHVLPTKQTVWLNLDNALTMIWVNNRTGIAFPGDKEAYIEVIEKPEDIVRM
jgi:hypothetical protein